MVSVSDSRKRGEENEAEEKGSSVVIKKIKTTCRSVKDHGGRGEEKKNEKKKKKKNERVAVCEQNGVPDACEQKEYSFDGEIEWGF